MSLQHLFRITCDQPSCTYTVDAVGAETVMSTWETNGGTRVGNSHFCFEHSGGDDAMLVKQRALRARQLGEQQVNISDLFGPESPLDEPES